ncbi:MULTISPECIES: hypothetical protein [unclassified Pseudomonas]|jgi:predicted MFS family arabinose efflux permease|uniref:hypothetical protein n=1 Tax=unclassified Pseudomonas TaxID=196821 RepID=UPI0015A13505|nr:MULTISPECIES: hypothetical protein [unclassified Pseudomonas]NWB20133.1 hypothetical protein [Pseudomonas sp. D4002]NWC02185.1 hypothetical protein [Pseudomonas sp. G1002]
MVEKISTGHQTDGAPEPEAKHKTSGSNSDITKIATTLGGAAVGNMIFPGIGGAIVGGLVGALIGRKAAKDEANGD